MKDLLSTSVHEFSGDILICGTCVPAQAKNQYEKLSENKQVYSVCLEKEHMNKIAHKLSTVMRLGNISGVSLLTLDGSPHCVQLHFIVQESKKNTGFKDSIEHYVVEKGELVKISPEKVKKARHLSML